MKKLIGVAILVAGSMAAFSLQDPISPGRAPLIPRITSPDQLVPFAKIIVQRDYIGQRLGWSIRGGERVLYSADTRVHPWVHEAFARALREMDCSVDVVISQRPKNDKGPLGLGYDPAEWTREIPKLIEERLSLDLNRKPSRRYGFGGTGGPRPPRPPGLSISEEEIKNYDVIIGPQGRIPGLAGNIPWVTPELLASVGAVYPGDIMDLIDKKAWTVIRNVERVEISDLQGSEASFTWFPEWWEIAEGTHPTIRSPGNMSTFGALRPGRSEYAIFAGHLMAHPRYGSIKGSDFKGKIVATVGQYGETIPKMTLWHDHGEIVEIEGGSYYGDMWRKAIDLTRDIQYPGYSRPGTAWIMEFSIGTNPKIFGPVMVEEFKGVEGRDLSRIRWSIARDGAGMIHVGYGSRGATWWARLMDMPVNHYHVRLFFTTYVVHTRGGERIKLLDKGRLPVMDDPEVRALAAKYGDPDEMLSVDWVPVLDAEGYLHAPEARLVSYEEFLENMPFKLDDPRLVYRIPDDLKDFYGEDRVRYYKPEEYMEFYRKLGQIPVKRVEAE